VARGQSARLSLALGVGYVIFWSLIGPVKEIETWLDSIAAGDFAQRVHVTNRDERIDTRSSPIREIREEPRGPPSCHLQPLTRLFSWRRRRAPRKKTTPSTYTTARGEMNSIFTYKGLVSRTGGWGGQDRPVRHGSDT
jgi:hypothetical protein